MESLEVSGYWGSEGAYEFSLDIFASLILNKSTNFVVCFKLSLKTKLLYHFKS